MSLADKDHPIWGLLGDAISWTPMIIIWVMITNKFDTEWYPLLALFAGGGAKHGVQALLAKHRQNANTTDD